MCVCVKHKGITGEREFCLFRDVSELEPEEEQTVRNCYSGRSFSGPTSAVRVCGQQDRRPRWACLCSSSALSPSTFSSSHISILSLASDTFDTSLSPQGLSLLPLSPLPLCFSQHVSPQHSRPLLHAQGLRAAPSGQGPGLLSSLPSEQ